MFCVCRWCFTFELIVSFFSVSFWTKFQFFFVLVKRKKTFCFIYLFFSVSLSLRLTTLSFQLGVPGKQCCGAGCTPCRTKTGHSYCGPLPLLGCNEIPWLWQWNTRVITVVKSCANVQWCAANGEQCSVTVKRWKKWTVKRWNGETVNSKTEQKSGVLRDKRVAVYSCCACLTAYSKIEL